METASVYNKIRERQLEEFRLKEQLDLENARAKKELLENKQYCDKLLKSM